MELVNIVQAYVTAVDYSWNMFIVMLVLSVYFPKTNEFFNKIIGYNPNKVLGKYYERFMKDKYNDCLTDYNQSKSKHIWIVLKVIVVLLILRVFYFFTFPYVIYLVLKNIYKNVCVIKN